MKHALAVLALVLASAASAGEPTTLGGTDFSFPALGALRAAAAQSPSLSPAPAAPAGDSVSMFPMAGTKGLAGYASSKAEADAAIGHWTRVLAAAGLEPGPASWESGVYVIPYSSPNGLALRRFAANPRQFAPKDPAALEADKARVTSAMKAAGLTLVAAPTARIDGLLPTYYVYYLAKTADTPEHEIQARVLDRGDDIDSALLSLSGVTVVETPRTYLAVYIGPRLSFVTLAAQDEAAARQKLAARVDYLRSQGCKVVGSKVLEDASMPEGYRWLAELYFFL